MPLPRRGSHPAGIGQASPLGVVRRRRDRLRPAGPSGSSPRRGEHGGGAHVAVRHLHRRGGEVPPRFFGRLLRVGVPGGPGEGPEALNKGSSRLVRSSGNPTLGDVSGNSGSETSSFREGTSREFAGAARLAPGRGRRPPGAWTSGRPRPRCLPREARPPFGSDAGGHSTRRYGTAPARPRARSGRSCV